MIIFTENQPHRMPQFIATALGLTGAAATAVAGGTVAAGSLAGKIVAGQQQANALEAAGRSELDARKEALRQQIEERKRIEGKATEAAKPSLREIEATNRLIADNDRNIGQAFEAVQNEIRTLEEATDPAIKAAGQNITNLLKGKAAAALGPIQKQRARQKAELQNQLKARFGAGFRTTTAGIQALNSFDDQTDLVMSDAQNRALTSVGQTFGTLAGARRAAVSGATGLVGTAASARSAEVQAEQNIAQRRLQASTAGLQSQVNFGQVADAAAAPFAGDIARGKTLGSAFGELGQVGGQLLGSGLGDLFSKPRAGRAGEDERSGPVESFTVGKTGRGGLSRSRN